VAVRVNFASALFAALAASVTTLLVSEMLAGLSPPAPAKSARERTQKENEQGMRPHRLRRTNLGSIAP